MGREETAKKQSEGLRNLGYWYETTQCSYFQVFMRMFPHSIHQILCSGTAKPTGALAHAEVALQSCCHPT